MMEFLQTAFTSAVHSLFAVDVKPEIMRPEPQFGDAASNIALQLAGQLKKPPREIAAAIAEKLQAEADILEATVAGPGFINIRLSDEFIARQLASQKAAPRPESQQEVVIEYLDPNPFKEIHIGHAYSGTVGDAIATLYEHSGAHVHRVTYQGDVGLHVARAIYGILNRIDHDPAKLSAIPVSERVRFLGEAYAEGAVAYETDEGVKHQIDQLNKKVYELRDPIITEVYETGRRWSLDYFETVYKLLDLTPFEKNYMERDVAETGLGLVQAHIADGVFEESEGAIIFRGEKFGLHTRVFVNSLGLPTYDAKDLGLPPLKFQDYHYDKSVIITGHEQAPYFEVMLKALEQFNPELSHKTTHISHGFVTLATGKMSSRTGKVLRAVEVFAEVEKAVKKVAPRANNQTVRQVALAAFKYSFLRSKMGGDIVFNIAESVSIEGNSGPYIQYAHARARSILSKGKPAPEVAEDGNMKFDEYERALAVKLLEFPEVVKRATRELLPHYICTYLYELAQTCNRFYEQSRVLGDPRELHRLKLVKQYADVLQQGLKLLNIPAPERL